MPRQAPKANIKPANMFDDRVVRLTKTVKPQSMPKPVSGVSSSILYNEDTGVLKVLKFQKGFGKAVRMAREGKKLSQKDLATKISKPVQTIAAIEKDDAIFDKLIFQRLEKALETKFDAMFSVGK
ncbi:hypothetical protein NEPAR06_0778 [Nematocida parisii]|uniref:HTH cro/C1-type domain-containing protein n=1 Tax=Nematocida parisii (strain ERTm3) TaxID=935791 RepID=I3EJ83_NEMP3|nr:uncharacterized protein NEPG_02518 [Nematocida parisii ERTm1]EIJ89280.1 hypothetical protein NEQG_00050 [Nematocida parisii ERTm3]KAI5125648.1 hypothetical protein NEPAR03_0176 [Nematocida parisii]EIJ92630.1 hypothetical protein NEPG_02518 [Nematocida parisii ERTm1]KAI5125730.1 hypothetical protein NEPAR08_0168 [Nematocida parisii]KAI5140237.1 hypothetical protein NEPAR04_0182 [Nematocida parisii]|eukprot:XP_013060345.1 hypothetical protein NEPG_02518 [Nematocida parisii ERTm1]